MAKPPQVAEYLGIPENTLKQWRYLGVGPRYHSVGRHVRYDWADIDAWKAKNASGGAAA